MRLFNSTLKLLFLAACLVIVSLAPAKDFTELLILVQDQSGSPVPRASIVIGRIVSKPGAAKVKVKKGRLQLRTSMQGSAPLPPMEQGRYMIQVISPGFQTYGSADLVLEQSEQSLTVILEPPQKQVSVHEKP
ncbi:MAG: carboxypeptidase-like regulatory domain-containing protein [Acidobacteria bacterium]|nr:carboxypeptidase-like regulatory domain-containing protein [Acidobacteriota bacterium]MDA1233223.1 carboxypeptidase-like regulatory domain-containing protein [Acidobacteriota bacterium]